MNRRPVFAAALAAAVLLPGPALASPAPATDASVSAFALDVASASVDPVADPVTLGVRFVPTGTAPDLSSTRFESVRYRPRSRYRARSSGPAYSSPVQLHAGFFDPEGDVGNSFVLGFRAGPQVDPHVQLGFAVDWMRKSENTTAVVSEQPGPGGTTIITRQELAESSSNLFPFMGYLQLSADQDLPLIPYFGLSGGYQLLFLSATDFATGQEFDGTFGGWAWQAWGGIALPLSGQSRIVGEIFVNEGEARRDVEDVATGLEYREIVSLDGVGARFGLSWGF